MIVKDVLAFAEFHGSLLLSVCSAAGVVSSRSGWIPRRIVIAGTLEHTVLLRAQRLADVADVHHVVAIDQLEHVFDADHPEEGMPSRAARIDRRG